MPIAIRKATNTIGLDGDMQCLEDDPNADVHVVQAGYASLTPIHINLTAQDSLDQLADWNTDYHA